MSRAWRSVGIAIGAATIAAGCATGSASTRTTASLATAPAARQLARSPALLAYVRAAERQISAQCSANVVSGPTRTAGHLELEIPLDSEGQLAAARVLRSSGDPQTDARAVAAVTAVRYLPALSADLTEQHMHLMWRLAVTAEHCDTVSVRVTARPMRASQVLEGALARGHYQRAREIVLQAGARADVIRVLRQTVQSRRARHVALASLRDTSLTPVETLLAQAESLDPR